MSRFSTQYTAASHHYAVKYRNFSLLHEPKRPRYVMTCDMEIQLLISPKNLKFLACRLKQFIIKFLETENSWWIKPAV